MRGMRTLLLLYQFMPARQPCARLPESVSSGHPAEARAGASRSWRRRHTSVEVGRDRAGCGSVGPGVDGETWFAGVVSSRPRASCGFDSSSRNAGRSRRTANPCQWTRIVTRLVNPSMRGGKSSGLVQNMVSRAPAHPPRRRRRSIWPISDPAHGPGSCTPDTHPLSQRPRESPPPPLQSTTSRCRRDRDAQPSIRDRPIARSSP